MTVPMGRRQAKSREVGCLSRECTETAVGAYHCPRRARGCDVGRGCLGIPSSHAVTRSPPGLWNAGNGSRIRSAAVSWSVDGAAWMDTHRGRDIGCLNPSRQRRATGGIVLISWHNGLVRQTVQTLMREPVSNPAAVNFFRECGGSRKGGAVLLGRDSFASVLALVLTVEEDSGKAACQ